MSPRFRHYRAFGLGWQSELPLPELRDADASGNARDVVVEIGPAPAPDIATVVTGVRAAHDTFWMEVPGVARYLVTGGTRIVVEPIGDAAEGDVRAFLLGSAVGALLHQRGVLPLHASAVEIGGRAVAFVAPSGGGKSTIAMHLHHLGQRVIADDLCAVELADGRARLWPGLRNLKLWRASLGAIDRAPDGFEPVLQTMDKYRVPIDALADDRAFDLAAVIRLDWGDASALTPLNGAEGVGVLVANTFRGQLVGPMARGPEHWRQCVELFAGSDVLGLTRPRALDRLEEASALVTARFAGADAS
ncbi:hypothetical protein HRV97_16710 [Sphingomonas sp. HHU CXW]|uniref:Serine kinase n=1 Tax=Sphingomonas hominis TaxID=2741495 RepID=A0ABX2JJH0_9SPHN|nr:hypothetical protein [Sphingomonas hominis]NTS66783.1 hypothetical protein [Sphingomonas hominis]